MPLGKYSDIDACVAGNQDKKDPKAYCGAIQAAIEEGVTVTEAELSATARADLPDSAFLYVSGEVRKLPIHDEEHMRNAWAVLHGARGGVDIPEDVKSTLINKLKTIMQDKGIVVETNFKLNAKIAFIIESIIINGKVHGILAIPRVSRNKNIYLPEELARGHGVTLPIYLEHEWQKDTNAIPIGAAMLEWHQQLQQLHFTGTVDKTKLPAGVTKWYASLGAQPTHYSKAEGYNIPRGLNFFEMSLVQNPGMPEALAVVENLTVTPVEAAHGDTGLTGSDTLVDGFGKHTTHINLNEDKNKKKKDDKMADEISKQIENLQTQMASILAENKRLVDATAVISVLQEKVRKLDPSYDHAKDAGHVAEGCAICLTKTIEALKADLVKVKPSAANMGATPGQHNDTFSKAVAVLTEWAWQSITGMGAPSGISVNVPFRALPKLDYSKPDYMAERNAFISKVTESLAPVTEAIATSDTGAGEGVTEISPVDIVPAQYSANLIDTVRVKLLAPGTDTARWQTLKELAVIALTQNTEPTEATATMTSVDAVPTPRGAQLSVSFEADKKVVGGITAAVAEAMRLAALNDVDALVNDALDLATGTAGDVFGGNATSEATVDAADTIAPANFADAINKITAKKYTAENLVAVISPKQFTDLLKHADVRQNYVFNGDVYRTGVIPRINGVEIRQSTGVNESTGSGTIVTYHALVYKKMLTGGWGVSRDVAIETQRFITKNQVTYKGHWDAIGKAIHPLSIARIITA